MKHTAKQIRPFGETICMASTAQTTILTAVFVIGQKCCSGSCNRSAAKTQRVSESQSIVRVHMRRTSLAFFLALVVSSSILSRPGQQTIQTNSDDALFITANLDWQKPPAKVHHSYKTSVASVLLFHPSGELEEVISLCQRDANGAVTIDLKGGYTIRKGNWKTTDDRSVDVK